MGKTVKFGLKMASTILFNVCAALLYVNAQDNGAEPQYCCIDLSSGSNAASYPVHYYKSMSEIPGSIGDARYKRTLLLLRYIEPTGESGYLRGSPPDELGRDGVFEDQKKVVLTKGFYIGIYEVTQQQWFQVMGNWPAYFSNKRERAERPVEKVSYLDIRGIGREYNWPQSKDVAADSFMGRLRQRTGITTFDLPTGSQWEWACRSGTTGALNNGTRNLQDMRRDPNLNTLGRYQYNGGYIDDVRFPGESVTTANGTAVVGSYKPNNWGIYDMHGNVWEWCLDNATNGVIGGEDPLGPMRGTYRLSKGGGWNYEASFCRSAFHFKSRNAADQRDSALGFRLAKHF